MGASRHERRGGCPAWIRTMTKASKGPCATVTPPDNRGVKVPIGSASAKEKLVCPKHERLIERAAFRPLPRSTSEASERSRSSAQTEIKRRERRAPVTDRG